MLDKKAVRQFINELGSSSPVPGGGSVSALGAALASALGSMVFNLTVDKKVYNEYGEKEKTIVRNNLEICLKNQEKFLELMNKDKEAFLFLMSTFKLPKETSDDKKIRSEKIQVGYQGALEIPLIVAEESFKLYDCIDIAAKLGNKNVISDAGVSVLMLQASIESAILNVKINLSSVKDEIYKEKIKMRCDGLINEGRIKRDKVLFIVNENL